MKIYSASVGAYATNCYIITDDATGEAAAVDCGVFDDVYRRMLRDAGVQKLRYILLTHGHFDHVCGVADLKDACGGEVCISAADAAGLTDEQASLNAFVQYANQRPVQPDRILSDGDVLTLGKTELRVMATPGHTRGSVCFLSDGVIFSGDTLFALSMGRTDMTGGSTMQLFQSLRAIGELPGNADVYPGHGEKTTLLFEKRYNRYLRQRENA